MIVARASRETDTLNVYTPEYILRTVLIYRRAIYSQTAYGKNIIGLKKKTTPTILVCSVPTYLIRSIEDVENKAVPPSFP